MGTNAESLIIGFNNKAADIYNAMFEQFQNSVFTVSRRKDDNVFRMQSAKYISALKERLEKEAQKILDDHSDENFYEQLNASFPAHINYYLQEFNNRVNSL